jgi:hypothetical protein
VKTLALIYAVLFLLGVTAFWLASTTNPRNVFYRHDRTLLAIFAGCVCALFVLSIGTLTYLLAR